MLNALSSTNSPFSENQIVQLRGSLEQLDPAQSAWLSGYLAGCLAVGVTATTEPAAPAQAQTAAIPALGILYASETGNGEGIAKALAAQAAHSGLVSELHSLEVFRPAGLKKLRYAVFVISTHGEGDPPEAAVEFFEYLASPAAPDLAHLQFSILALGDRSYPRFCEAGRQLEALLRACGAKPFANRIDCDIDYQAAASAWVSEVVDYGAGELERAPAEPATGGKRLSVVPVSSGWTRQRPFQAVVQRVQKITGSGSTKDVHHVELSLADSGIRYEPGDSMGVWAPNPEEAVNGVLTALGLDPTVRVEHDGEDRTVHEWLRGHRELTRLTASTVQGYAQLSGNEALLGHLGGLDEPGCRAFIEQRQFIDVVEEFPGRLAAADLLRLLRPLSPRSYSIASSQATVDEEAHLTVATRCSEVAGSVRRGLASDHLNHRLKVGERVGVFLEPNRRFHLPADRGKPLILVGAGTGIAPFRAFLQQLEEKNESPDTWLVYGNPRLRTDFLYQREWLRWRSRGLLNRIDTAFSRDRTEKRYVQHLVAAYSNEIVEWLDRGAHLYICGSLAMGRGVESALLEGVAEWRGLAPAAAADWLAEVRREKRLLKDLY